MDFATKTITAGGGPGTHEYATSVLQDKNKIAAFRNQVANGRRREKSPTQDQLRQAEEQGHDRRPLRPPHSDKYKVSIADTQERWEKYAISRGGECDWRELIKQISWEKKGIIDGFLKWLVERGGSRVRTESTLVRYMLQTWTVYQKYTGHPVDPAVREHGLRLARIYTYWYKLRREPAMKHALGPGLFVYLIHFRLVRDRTAFNIGLDRLNDVTIRIFQMYTACRTHELAYDPHQHPERNHPGTSKKVAEYHDPHDAYADLEPPQIQHRPRNDCWGCGGTNDRVFKVLCWEDVDLMILRNPLNDGRDRLVMQVLLRFHKGENKEIRPTAFLFVEEDLPLICPVANILAKALAEDVIDLPTFSTSRLFNTGLALPVVRIPWKKKFRHKPVFRQSKRCPEKGFVVSDEPVTRKTFDNRTSQLGLLAGLLAALTSYFARRGQLQALDAQRRKTIRNQIARHKDGAIYERWYTNPVAQVITQDAFMQRDTNSPIVSMVTDQGLECDENAPTAVPDEIMDAMGPSAEVVELEEEMASLRDRLKRDYGKAHNATGPDKAEYVKLQRKLAAAKQKDERDILRLVRKDYFELRNEREVRKQLHSDSAPIPQGDKLEPVAFGDPGRRRLAEIMVDLREDLPHDLTVRRKVEGIDAWVAYALKPERREAPVRKRRRRAVKVLEWQPKGQQAGPGMPIVTSPVNTAMDTTGLPTIAPSPRRTPSTPPPPYETVADTQTSSGKILATGQKRYPKPPPCIFCGATFERVTSMWSHVERLHLDLMDGPIRCPFSLCQDQGSSFHRYGFLCHLCHDHGIYLRPDKDGPSTVPTKQRAGTDDSALALRKKRVGGRNSRTPSTPVETVTSVPVNRRVGTEDGVVSSPPKITEQSICKPNTVIILKRMHSEEGPKLPPKRRIVVTNI